MKFAASSSAVLFALGMLSASAIAQGTANGATSDSQGAIAIPVPPSNDTSSTGTQDQSNTNQSGAQSGGDQSGIQSSGDSSGASSNADQSADQGQTITREIVNARPRADDNTVRIAQQSSNGVSYLCGGVGDNETAFMKQQAPGYDMMMTFAARNGNYVSDVNVSISDNKGQELLRTNCGGPLMLVNFPHNGVYRVQAEAAGNRLDRTVKVNTSRHATAVFTWPQDAVARQTATNATSGGSGSSTGSSQSPGMSGSKSEENSSDRAKH